MGRKESNQTKGQIWYKLEIMQELGKKGHFIILFIFVIVIAMSLKQLLSCQPRVTGM